MAKLRPKTVENARYVEYVWPHANGFMRHEPYLYVELDGQDVAIWHEQPYLDKYGVVVFVPMPGSVHYDHERNYKAVLPEEDWRPRQEKLGATADRRIVKLTRRYWQDVFNRRWEPGKRLEVE